MSTRGVLTMAFGAPRYVEMAKTLARSLQFHSPDTPRAVVTDSADPELAALFPITVPLQPERGTGVAQKLSLYDYSPFDETLFIDADSIAVRSIDPLWTLFADTPVGVVGRPITSGQWFMDVAQVCERFGVPSLPHFNGGLYYFRRCAEAAKVFDAARSLLARYGELQLIAFRGGANDEPLMAIALATHGISAVDDGGCSMRTPIGIEGKLHMDVVSGRCQFVKQGVLVRPAVVHFAGDFAAGAVYRRERMKLRHLRSSRQANWCVARGYDALYALDGPLRRLECWTDEWCRRELRAWRELRRHTPPGSAVVLIDDQQWDRKRAPEGRRLVPFLERDGDYWGTPPDDDVAIEELERLRAEGVTHLGVGWPSRWWLEHYPRFNEHLREHYARMADSPRLVLFDLRRERSVV